MKCFNFFFLFFIIITTQSIAYSKVYYINDKVDIPQNLTSIDILVFLDNEMDTELELLQPFGLIKWLKTEVIPTIEGKRDLFRIHYCGETIHIKIHHLLSCPTSIASSLEICKRMGLGLTCSQSLLLTAPACGLEAKMLENITQNCLFPKMA